MIVDFSMCQLIAFKGSSQLPTGPDYVYLCVGDKDTCYSMNFVPKR